MHEVFLWKKNEREREEGEREGEWEGGREAEREGGGGERERERKTAGDVMQLNTRCWSLFDKTQNTRHISWQLSSCPEATDPNFYIQASACSLLSWSDYLAGKHCSVNNFSSVGTQ